MGVAPEIRLRALDTTDAEERLALVLRATEESLEYMHSYGWPRLQLLPLLRQLLLLPIVALSHAAHFLEGRRLAHKCALVAVAAGVCGTVFRMGLTSGF
jgi:hypothetical protein